MADMGVLAVSNRERKLITSLRIKKYRDLEELFVAEGNKVIEPLLANHTPRLVVSSEPRSVSSVPAELLRSADESQLKAMSSLQTPPTSIAVFEQPKEPTPYPPLSASVVVALDAIQNPGNLGTIIRLCDWLGIRHLVLGSGTVDPYSSKVVQATAGALGAVHLYPNVDLTDYLSTLDEGVRVVGTALDGVEVAGMGSSDRSVVLFGNEGHGLSAPLLAACSELIHIPAAPGSVSESLNVSISAAIILSKITGIV